MTDDVTGNAWTGKLSISDARGVMAKRSIVYIDGFNLYYGSVRGTPYKWLNLQRYFTLLRPDDDLQQIHYFTALIDGPTQPNQVTYLKALGTLPLMHVVLGKFKTKRVRCGVSQCTFGGTRFFPASEEKRTDVNIAVHILDDAYQNRCDRFVLVSGDSDLVPAVDKVKALFPTKEMIVYVPSRDPIRGAAVELRSAADKHRSLPLNLFPRAQFPLTLPDGFNGLLKKPSHW